MTGDRRRRQGPQGPVTGEVIETYDAVGGGVGEEPRPSRLTIVQLAEPKGSNRSRPLLDDTLAWSAPRVTAELGSSR